LKVELQIITMSTVIQLDRQLNKLFVLQVLDQVKRQFSGKVEIRILSIEVHKTKPERANSAWIGTIQRIPSTLQRNIEMLTSEKTSVEIQVKVEALFGATLV